MEGGENERGNGKVVLGMTGEVEGEVEGGGRRRKERQKGKVSE